MNLDNLNTFYYALKKIIKFIRKKSNLRKNLKEIIIIKQAQLNLKKKFLT